MMKVDLLLIDPQNDFCDPAGALSVPGGDQDAERLATMLERITDKIHDIHVTLDTHHRFHIANPIFWKNSDGENPDPFTIITADDVEKGRWRTTIPALADYAKEYVRELERGGRYDLCIWPPHCLIGSWGHMIYPRIFEALDAWTIRHVGFIDFVTKGSNFKTEHYSAVQADVPDSEDPTSQLNTELIETLKNVDMIAISGQALSHCVANTIYDVADNFGEDNIKKFVFLEDTSSNVPGFEDYGNKFLADMTARGMQTAKSTDFLA